MTSLPNLVTDKHSGQALLIVLLVMAVSLTVVLSIASRSISDVSTTRLEEESLRAFSAAETGVENALNDPQIGTRTGNVVDATEPGSPASYEITVSTPVVDSREFLHPAKPYSGEAVTFWFVGHDGSGNISCNGVPCFGQNSTDELNVCWGNSGTPSGNSSTPAIELSVYYDTSKNALSGDFSGVVVVKEVYDPNNSRQVLNKFSNSVNCDTVSGADLEFSTDNVSFTSLGIPSSCVSDAGCLLMAKVKPFYNSDGHSVGIKVTGSDLPPQGIQVESVGQAGESTRKVNVYQTYAEIPSVLDAAVFSLNDLSK